MTFTECKIVYFQKTGKENSEKCLELVSERVKKGDINHIVVA